MPRFQKAIPKMPLDLALALPGALETLTGGSFYDRRLVESLRAAGHGVAVVPLPEGFPDPGAEAVAAAVAQLAAQPAGRVVIVDGLAYGALPTAALAGIAAPMVAMVHHPLAMEPGMDGVMAEGLWRRERDNLALARHVLVPSGHVAGLLVARYGVPQRRITVLEPGVDRPAGFEAAKAEPPLILSVGLLDPRKGHDVLIAALDRLGDLDWQAVIAGTLRDAAHVAALEAQVAASPLAGRIRLAGRVSMAERDRLYAAASVFALATRYEGYGIVFNEALIAGLPIVSCRAGAVPGTVPADAGLLVPPDDPAAFAAALRVVLMDGARRAAMAVAARQAGAALPGWDGVARRAAEVLAQVAVEVGA